MTTKELIRDEIRKWQSNIEAKCPESTSSRNYTKEEWNAIYEYNAYTRILSFLDTLPDEPITTCNELAEKKTFDDYLKASPSERRKMNMTEILGEERLAKTKRTMEPVTDCHDLEEVAEAYSRQVSRGHNYRDLTCGFKAGAEWQKAKMLKDNPVIMSVEDFQALIDSNAKRVEADYKEKILKEAVEGYVNYYEDSGGILMAETQVGCPYHNGDKVKIIIVKEEE